MRIKQIEIKNFKGFQHETISFCDNLTVVIGNNTAGKTTLLKALQVGLGAYLQSLSKLPGGQMYRRNFSSLDRYKAFDPIQRDYVSNPDKPRITIWADYPKSVSADGVNYKLQDEPITWYREFAGKYTTNTKECAGQLMEQVELIEGRRKDDKVWAI